MKLGIVKIVLYVLSMFSKTLKHTCMIIHETILYTSGSTVGMASGRHFLLCNF